MGRFAQPRVHSCRPPRPFLQYSYPPPLAPSPLTRVPAPQAALHWPSGLCLPMTWGLAAQRGGGGRSKAKGGTLGEREAGAGGGMCRRIGVEGGWGEGAGGVGDTGVSHQCVSQPSGPCTTLVGAAGDSSKSARDSRSPRSRMAGPPPPVSPALGLWWGGIRHTTLPPPTPPRAFEACPLWTPPPPGSGPHHAVWGVWGPRPSRCSARRPPPPRARAVHGEAQVRGIQERTSRMIGGTL